MSTCNDVQINIVCIPKGTTDCDVLIWNTISGLWEPGQLTANCILTDPIEICGVEYTNLQTILEVLAADVRCVAPNLAITKVPSTAGPVEALETFTETITVTNTGDGDATNVVVTNSMLNGLEIIGADPFPVNVGTVSAGSTVIVAIVTVRAPAGSEGLLVGNTVTATHDDGSAQDSVAITVSDDAEVSLLKEIFAEGTTDPITTANPGETVTYRVTVSNASGADAVVVVDDVVDSGVTISAPNPFPYTTGAIAAGGNEQFTFDAVVTGAGGATVTNTVEVDTVNGSAPDSPITADVDVTINNLSATISVVKNDTGGSEIIEPQPQGTLIDIVTTITNTSDGDAVITATLPLASGLNYISGNTSPFVTGTLAPAASQVFTTRVELDTTNGTTITCTGTITDIAGTAQVGPSDDASVTQGTLAAAVDLIFLDTGANPLASPVPSGTDILLRTIVVNTSPIDAVIEATLPFPGNFTYVSGDTSPYTTASLTPLGSQVFDTVVTVAGAGDEVVSATATITEINTIPQVSPSDTEQLTIESCVPDLEVTKTISLIDIGGLGSPVGYSGQDITVCDILTFQIEVTNNAACDFVTGGSVTAIVRELLPPELAWLDASHPGTNILGGGEIIGFDFNVPSLASAASTTLIFRATAAAATEAGSPATNTVTPIVNGLSGTADTLDVTILGGGAGCLDDPDGLLGEFGTPEAVDDVSSLNGDLGTLDNLTDVVYDVANSRLILVDDSGKIYTRDPDPAVNDLTLVYQDPAFVGTHVATSDYEGVDIFGTNLYVVAEWGKEVKVFDLANIAAGPTATFNLGPVIGISGCGSFPADCTDETVVCGPTPWSPGVGNEIPGVQNAGPNSISIYDDGSNVWMNFTVVWDGSVHRVELNGPGTGLVAGTGARLTTPFNANTPTIVDQGPTGSVTPSGAGPWTGVGSSYSTYWCFERNAACNLGGFGLNRRATVTGSFLLDDVLYVINACEAKMYAINPDTGELLSERWNIPTINDATGLSFAEFGGNRWLYITRNDGEVVRFDWPLCIDQGTGAAAPCGVPPTAIANVDTINGLDVDWDATGSFDTDGTIDHYIWDFGDGTYGSGATPSHTYGGDGTYDWVLYVEDNDGLRDVASGQVTVSAAACVRPVSGSAIDVWYSDDPANEIDGPFNVFSLLADPYFNVIGVDSMGWNKAQLAGVPTSPAYQETTPAQTSFNLHAKTACLAGYTSNEVPQYANHLDRFGNPMTLGNSPNGDPTNVAFGRDLDLLAQNDPPITEAAYELALEISSRSVANPIHYICGGPPTTAAAAMQILKLGLAGLGTLTETQITQRLIVHLEGLTWTGGTSPPTTDGGGNPTSAGNWSDQFFNMRHDPMAYKIIFEWPNLNLNIIILSEILHPDFTFSDALLTGGATCCQAVWDYYLDRRANGTDTECEGNGCGHPTCDPCYWSADSTKLAGAALVAAVSGNPAYPGAGFVQQQIKLPEYPSFGTLSDDGNLLAGGAATGNTVEMYTVNSGAAVTTALLALMSAYDCPANCTPAACDFLNPQ